MASLPTNRVASRLGLPASAVVPTRVQSDGFGSRQAAVAGGTLVTGRPPQTRPTITTPGTAQSRESFVSQDGESNGAVVARALNAIQSNIASSTSQARAFPLANGHLFQNVPLVGTPTAGVSLPPSTGLPAGFMFIISRPLWLLGSNWVDSTGAVATPATNGTQAYTAIDHGFGSPATGFVITNVKNAAISYTPYILPAGDSTDNNTVRIWLAFATLGTSPTADFYVFR